MDNRRVEKKMNIEDKDVLNQNPSRRSGMARAVFILLVTGLLATLVSCQGSTQAPEANSELVRQGTESLVVSEASKFRPEGPQVRQMAAAAELLEESAAGDDLAFARQPCEDPGDVEAFIPSDEEKAGAEPLPALEPSPEGGGVEPAADTPLFVEGLTRINYKKFRVVRRIEREEVAPTAIRVRYRVMVEEGLEEEASVLTEMADEVLNHPEGWRAAGFQFEQVEQGQDISIVLANPRTVDALCAPIPTGSVLSCAAYRRANLNVWRWRQGAQTWDGEGIEGYRSYLINHEVGHLLGMGHVKCPAPGTPAPVMLPQTKYLKRCLPNGHPTSKEVKKLESRKTFTMKKLSLKHAHKAH